MPPQPNALEDLIVENKRSHTPELNVARGMPRDEQATADLKGDPDRLARLATLADVEQARIVDVAVRGSNVTFQVADGLDGSGQPTGALSAGFFPLSDVQGSGKAKRGGVQSLHRPSTSPQGGTASVPSVEDPDRGTDDDPPTDDTGGTVPDDLDGRNVGDTAALFSEDGVDKQAVLDHELARDEPRKGVLDAARKAGLDVPDDG